MEYSSDPVFGYNGQERAQEVMYMLFISRRPFESYVRNPELLTADPSILLNINSR
jgi:hypothetical protein